jgi:hypothetical protein
VELTPLPFRASLSEYEKQAGELLDAWKAGDPGAIGIFRQTHPRFLDPHIEWLPQKMSDSEVREVTLEPDDARLAVARWYDFESWPRLAEYVESVTRKDSPVSQFESGVEAVVDGDAATLTSLLRENPDLVRARSARVTHFAPPVHRATLLHYVAANGVEGHRQRTLANAVEIAGEDPNRYNPEGNHGHTTPLHQAVLGGHGMVVRLLVERGARLDIRDSIYESTPLGWAEYLGRTDIAELLRDLGA